jgi:hypothetical protein
MLSTLRNPNLEHEVRMDAAKAAAPYIHPKLVATTNTNRNANLEFAGKTGEQIRNQLVLRLIDKGVLIPGPNDVIPDSIDAPTPMLRPG